ncbi:MAG: hypothetical protein UY35_C0006G0027 [Candidatus Saccharibacteria bacterium GW2011_GWC2_48_9]|nr:MAG: hypothetical protein UY35_C0006G0027 [Candidatus Saccharibacteria bacterium GW2011_GWC2_48_9]HCH34264.1 hypothetical protein [Candidatus Saccharibacteria bacterium]
MQDTYPNIETGLGQGTIPDIDLSSLTPILSASLVVTLVLTVLLVVYAIYSTARRRKVERATINMQKDIRIIRELMEKQGSNALQAIPPTPSLHNKSTDTLAVTSLSDDTSKQIS